MNAHYLFGVAFGILGGILTQAGQLLEKKAINVVRKASPDRYLRRLVQNRLWVFGFTFGIGGGTVAYILAQSMIGPALVPGLMAFGLIVLAIGSVKMNHEELNASEILGIFLMIIGVFLLGLSGLEITTTQVNATLEDKHALVRIALFTGVFFLFFIIIRSLISQIKNRRGILIALGNGFLSCLTDFWVNPLIAVIFIVLKGQGTTTQTVIFILACIILISSGGFITWQNQLAFKYAQASNIVPVAQVPIQISPVVVYFFVFALTPPKATSIFYILSGTILTIVAGFLLGRRQEVPLD
jgi:drug/metabolite transporter (DMT)-like permease